ncbi:efflux RND transporter periplasmic adaptor subunit [Phaeovulum vinaykumarii]|uniref:Multidrug resistance efflux pump n=1 Tax=Phaeovulum vinaykumarii TaxID=407234 RepID=A0A1N7LRN4_9RHOB|nr:HlyD family efflux transporter periplasmic adaptor subunit [Phaeovulum vinaykumarii]SIS76505.1 Multidrug resistance efflux pump [Phaeovulum vinaykumarii]SOC07830.1 multidrug resistance efflux pump [Phaeovulum vinaykumarii]
MRIGPFLAVPPIVLGIAAAAWLIGNAPGPAQVDATAAGLSVRVETVAQQTIRPASSVWGNLRAAETWVAVAEVQGEVIWRHPDLEQGRMIPAGTEVLRIDPADYELALGQAEADLAALRAERGQIEIEAANTSRILELERARLALSEADLQRTRTLVSQGTVPQTRADEAERATLLARRTVTELENTLSLVPSREQRLDAQIARTESAADRARRSLDRTTLTAPFDLRVTEVAIELFQSVNPGQIVIRGDGLDAVEVVAHLPIDAFRRLIPGLPEGVELQDAMREGPADSIDVAVSPIADPGQIWSGRVTRVEGALDARARTVPVVVTIADPYESADPPNRLPLVPNMQVRIALTGAPLLEVVTVPEAALHGGIVLVADADDRLELRQVTPGFAQDGRIVIAQGLVPGERVVIDAIAPAIPGLSLSPVEVAR